MSWKHVLASRRLDVRVKLKGGAKQFAVRAHSPHPHFLPVTTTTSRPNPSVDESAAAVNLVISTEAALTNPSTARTPPLPRKPPLSAIMDHEKLARMQNAVRIGMSRPPPPARPTRDMRTPEDENADKSQGKHHSHFPDFRTESHESHLPQSRTFEEPAKQRELKQFAWETYSDMCVFTEARELPGERSRRSTRAPAPTTRSCRPP